MFNRIIFLLVIALIVSVVPACAVQIEETNTYTSNSISNIEEYKTNMEGDSYAFRNNNTTTPVVNGTGGLAPLTTNETNEDFSTTEKWIIGILIITLLISIFFVCRAYISMNIYESNFKNVRMNNLDRADFWAANVDAYVERTDYVRAMVEWCPNLDSETIQELQGRLESGYNNAYDRYITYDNLYLSMADPNDVMWTGEWALLPRQVHPFTYQDAKLWLPRWMGIGSFSLMGLLVLLGKKYIH